MPMPEFLKGYKADRKVHYGAWDSCTDVNAIGAVDIMCLTSPTKSLMKVKPNRHKAPSLLSMKKAENRTRAINPMGQTLSQAFTMPNKKGIKAT